jgi:hypothetical protein
MAINKNELTPADLAFLTAIHNKHLNLDKLVETRGQVLIVAAGLIFTFSLTQVVGSLSVHNNYLLGWLIIAMSSLIAIVIVIWSIQPKIFVKGKSKNLFYYGSFINNLSQEEYAAKLSKTIGDEKETVESFTEEIYTLAENILIPGFKKVRGAYYIFITGLIL